ncbi:hypothetical protein ACIU1J_29350 [Azospirillum doebereinerae]|uniref:hypothetical protein n=1 Tax=Azospirillum doebereinerae TaxID=92933 RepID=UPI0038512433
MAKRNDGANGSGGKGGSFTGTPADRLIRLWRSNDQRFGVLLDEVLDSGRQPVIEAAIAKLREDESYAFIDEVDAFSETLQRTDSYGDPSTVTLFWLAVEVEGDLTEAPPAEAIERALDSSGLLENAADTRLLPLWLDPEPLAYLEAADRRTLLHRLLASTDEAADFVRKQDLLAPVLPAEETPRPALRRRGRAGRGERRRDRRFRRGDPRPAELRPAAGRGAGDRPGGGTADQGGDGRLLRRGARGRPARAALRADRRADRSAGLHGGRGVAGRR